jgi:hypothetical protein
MAQDTKVRPEDWPDSPPVILSVDPGRNSGWAIFEPKPHFDTSYKLVDYGCIYNLTTHKVNDLLIALDITSLILCLEDQYVSPKEAKRLQGKITKLVINRSRWQVLAELICVPAFPVNPTLWQRDILGIAGRGTKRDMRKKASKAFVESTHHITPSVDTCDAICIGHYCISQLVTYYPGRFFTVVFS